ncbi:uncharacterized protein PITG_14553 [Phytophthora infestans T30-4]|uniref:Uncharacterized protein n=1 Tax=Phytophthora infestans (strain T30-4) TaxID=403677 RepID=D0NQI6_PHYIT|nr:uncharacterized protein PITG_14553 [Phytophthora infestans T30-4]EEY62934.1 hypothetical protein PITG_14553 [Phytophthora infestans T30-4]|eukprot:XP_002898457.1 hypothetical protein PITG_14553 [Phytophthora infestans T30-4]
MSYWSFSVIRFGHHFWEVVNAQGRRLCKAVYHVGGGSRRCIVDDGKYLPDVKCHPMGSSLRDRDYSTACTKVGVLLLPRLTATPMIAKIFGGWRRRHADMRKASVSLESRRECVTVRPLAIALGRAGNEVHRPVEHVT